VDIPGGQAGNAKRIRISRISCYGAPAGTLIDCLDFISAVGEAALNRLNGHDRDAYPRLNSFEDVMIDCVVAGYLQRSALQWTGAPRRGPTTISTP
jgi:hypothetical protein